MKSLFLTTVNLQLSQDKKLKRKKLVTEARLKIKVHIWICKNKPYAINIVKRKLEGNIYNQKFVFLLINVKYKNLYIIIQTKI